MSTPESMRLEVKVSHAYSERFPDTTSQAEAFWDPLIKRRLEQFERGSRQEIPSISVLESKLTVALPRHLRQTLNQYFLASYTRVPRSSEELPGFPTSQNKAASLIPFVGISIATIRYASLDLSIEFTGVKHLVELFDSNFDLFMMFAQTYLPMAFADSMLELEIPRSDFSFQMIPTAKMAAAFVGSAVTPTQVATPPAISTPQVTSGLSDRSKAIWQIANFSLLFPVGLALLVLYVAAKSIAEEKADLREWRKDLSSREQAHSKLTQDRLIQLEKVQAELVTLLRDSAKAPEKKK